MDADVPTVEAGNPWVPLSPCDTGCVPDIAGASRTRTIMRITGFILVALTALLGGAVTFLTPRRVRYRYWRASARACLKAMGVRLQIDDRRPREARAVRGALVVANHISYLDIVAVAAVAPSKFIAKSEVTSMPGFGLIARCFGVLSHVRGDLGRLAPMVDEVSGILDKGRPVTVFPEGTTWCGAASGRFRPAFFQSAVDAGVPILPIRLTYIESGRPSTRPSFIGDDTVGATFMRIVTAPKLTVELTVFELQLPVPDRKVLARDIERLIAPATDLSDRIFSVDIPAEAPRSATAAPGTPVA